MSGPCFAEHGFPAGNDLIGVPKWTSLINPHQCPIVVDRFRFGWQGIGIGNGVVKSHKPARAEFSRSATIQPTT